MARTEDNSPRFDVAALREAAGDKVFARGVAYHKDGQVEIIAIEPGRVLARVVGTEIYRTTLMGGGAAISGACTCPAFSDWGFCKHMVATALAANAAGAGGTADAAGRLSRIRAHLLAQGAEALTDRILALAERDPDLWSQLDLAASADTEDEAALFSRFRKALTDATRTRGYVEYADMGGWAERIEGVLGQVEVLVAGHPDVALRLIDHAHDRLETALGEVDDSNGEGSALLWRVREIHLAACRGARPDPVALAQDLFDKTMESDWDAFDGADESHAEVLGEAGLAEYRRLALAAWAKLEPPPRGRHLHDPNSSARYRLKAMLDGFARRDGDLDARIALRARDLSSAYAHLEVAEVCMEHRREDLALSWAEEGLWRFEDEPDERLTRLAAELMRRAGQAEKADGLLWSAFERRPSLELFRQLRTAGDPEAVTDRAAAILDARLAAKSAATARGIAGPAADLLVSLLMEAERLPAAWAAVHKYGCGDGVLAPLARLSEETCPEEALAAYAGMVDREVGRTSRGGYEAACKLVRRMARVRAGLGQEAAQADYVERLAATYKVKRTFVELLRDETKPQRAG